MDRREKAGRPAPEELLTLPGLQRHRLALPTEKPPGRRPLSMGSGRLCPLHTGTCFLLGMGAGPGQEARAQRHWSSGEGRA